MAAMRARIVPQEVKFTSAEFQKLSEANEGYELINGSLVRKSMPNEEHSTIGRIILKAYDRFDPDEKIGRLLYEINVELDEKNIAVPDLAFWTFNRKPGRSRAAASIPDLVVEMWSPHDFETKKRLEQARAKCFNYITAGVKIVWAINPSDQTVEVYYPDSLPQTLTVQQSLEAENLIPGFKLLVAKLFED